MPLINFHSGEFLKDCHRLFKFALVGLTTAAIFFGSMWLFESFFKLNYLISISLAYFFSTGFHFLANKYFTFNCSNQDHGMQMIRYLILWFVNYGITLFVVSFLVTRFDANPYIGVCFSVVITMAIGFILSKYWVFQVKKGLI